MKNEMTSSRIDLFNFFADEHNLLLTESEMQNVIWQVQKDEQMREDLRREFYAEVYSKMREEILNESKKQNCVVCGNSFLAEAENQILIKNQSKLRFDFICSYCEENTK